MAALPVTKRLPVQNGKKAPKKNPLVRGRPVATFGGGVTMVRTTVQGEVTAPEVRPADQALVLVSKAGRALKKPGIDRSVVFRAHASDIFSYSVLPSDPSKVIREAADGTVTVGRLVSGKFRAIQPNKAA